MRKVAESAGVSIGTVSRVLNSQPGVSEMTRERVLAAVQELNYLVPKRVPIIRSQVTHLGLLILPLQPDPLTNPFYTDVYHGVEQSCREAHINLSLCALDIAGDRLRSLPALTQDDRISGIIMVGAIPLPVLEELSCELMARRGRNRFPFVLANNWFAGCPWDAVVIDNAAGVTLALESLFKWGHQQIAFIGGPRHTSILERTAAYEKVMQQHGLNPRIIRASGLDPQDGECAVDELLRSSADATAILCANDSQAIGAMRRLKELGHAVPEDFSVIGFDDIHMAELTLPRLTTVRVDRRTLGRIAVELLSGQLSAPERPTVKSIVGVRLIERDSVARPRSNE